MPQRLVCDANVLIDLDVGQLLKVVFELDFEFVISDVVFYQELSNHHPELVDLGLVLLELDGAGVSYVAELAGTYQGQSPSRNDLFGVGLARQENCPLLTGDLRLRVVCDEIGIEVHGTLWLVNHLLEQGRISAEAAAAAYELMKSQSRWLPWAEVEQQLKRFGLGT